MVVLVGLLKKCNEYLRLMLFMAALLAGVQLPGFVQQYEDAVLAHLAEARLALAPFERDARIHTQGDVTALIKRYQQNSDAAVRDGAASIQQLLQRVIYLEQVAEQLQANALVRGWYALLQPDSELFAEVQSYYDYRVPLNLTAIIWGLTCGILFAAVFDFVVALLVWMLPKRRSKSGA
ncbi:DUF2937 family protein [Bowmanella denitrificans]